MALVASDKLCAGSQQLQGTYAGVPQCFVACSLAFDPPASYFSFQTSGDCWCFTGGDDECQLTDPTRRALQAGRGALVTYKIVVPASRPPNAGVCHNL